MKPERIWVDENGGSSTCEIPGWTEYIRADLITGFDDSSVNKIKIVRSDNDTFEKISKGEK